MNTIPQLDEFAREEGNEELWHQVFQIGHPVLAQKQRRYSMLPGRTRCKMCYAPLNGFGGWITKRMGLEASSRNPLFCNACDGFLKAFPGGAEVDLAIMFCDLRGSVEISSRMSPKEFKELIVFMRETIIPVLWRSEGFVLQFQGDSIIGVWPPGFSGEDYVKKAVEGAFKMTEVLKSATFKGESVPVGIALHSGRAYLGTVASVGNDLQEISAFGYDVNVAARLSDAAKAGEVLISEAALNAAGRQNEVVDLQSFELKGVEMTVQAGHLIKQ
jgi:adenylate cyclase